MGKDDATDLKIDTILAPTTKPDSKYERALRKALQEETSEAEREFYRRFGDGPVAFSIGPRKPC